MKKEKKLNNLHYNKSLKIFASQLRNNMTKSECCLWKFVLSAKQMKGYTFNRQRPVLDYIADFMCKELKIIIELDGITHHDEKVQLKDTRKDIALNKVGFIILRFEDNQVLDRLNSVKEAIEECIVKREKQILMEEELRKKCNISLNPPPEAL